MFNCDGVRRQLLAVSLHLAVLAAGALFALPTSAENQSNFGPFGPEGPRMREQLWILPGGAPETPLRATVFRPPHGDGPDAVRQPLVVINHGTSDDTRLSVAMPVYYWLSRWFVERGYVVVLPQRRGHGSTGGKLAEAVGNCANPDHFKSGQIAADDIQAVVEYMSTQDFIEPNATVVAGISTGGWASLALASRNPENVSAIVNIAGGRGGHAGGRRNAICGETQLVAAASAYGRTSRIPGLWLYSKNDSYFSPALAGAMASAWKDAGGDAELHVLPAYRSEGHEIANDEAGWRLWGPALDRFLLDSKSAQPAVETSGLDIEKRVLEPASLTAGQ